MSCSCGEGGEGAILIPIVGLVIILAIAWWFGVPVS